MDIKDISDLTIPCQLLVNSFKMVNNIPNKVDILEKISLKSLKTWHFVEQG